MTSIRRRRQRRRTFCTHIVGGGVDAQFASHTGNIATPRGVSYAKMRTCVIVALELLEGSLARFFPLSGFFASRLKKKCVNVRQTGTVSVQLFSRPLTHFWASDGRFLSSILRSKLD